MDNPPSSFILTSSSGNSYLFDRRTRTFILCHPILGMLAKMREDGIDIQKWISDKRRFPFSHDDTEITSSDDLEYYFGKLNTLERNGDFTAIDNNARINYRIKSIDRENAFANANSITFEVTDDCNLKCGYCIYGDLYDIYDDRSDKCMDADIAKNALDFISSRLNSSLNNSNSRDFLVGFYGGEPLLHFDFIKEITQYVQQLQLKHNTPRFVITTNGLLLGKHMDFLARNDFSILISLDGSEANNGYRLTKNDRSSFGTVMSSILALKEKHPQFFTNRVAFNAVLHNRNSVADIIDFFTREFSKTPMISPISDWGVARSMKERFSNTSVSRSESLESCPNKQEIERTLLLDVPHIASLHGFLGSNGNHIFYNYNDFFESDGSLAAMHTATCMPFEDKFFVTVNGKMLACEKIGHAFALGHVDREGVKIDLREAADKFNSWLDAIKKSCASCL